MTPAKNKGGRPLGSLSGTQTAHVHVRCAPDELARWRAAAELLGQDFTAFVRAALDARAALADDIADE